MIYLARGLFTSLMSFMAILATAHFFPKTDPFLAGMLFMVYIKFYWYSSDIFIIGWRLIIDDITKYVKK